MQTQIKYQNLSGPLKTAIVLSYIVGACYALAFMIGFVIGVAGV